MNIPDISHLVFTYVVYPEYKFIDQVQEYLDRDNTKYYNLPSEYPSILANPKARKYIRYCSFSLEQTKFIQQNPDTRMIKLALNRIEFFIRNPMVLSIIFKKFNNPNPEYVEKMLCTFYKGEPEKIFDFSDASSYPLDPIVNKYIELLNKKIKIMTSDFCRNPHDKAVDYLLDNFDTINKSIGLCSFALNTNIRIIKKIEQEFEKVIKTLDVNKSIGNDIFQTQIRKMLEIDKSVSNYIKPIIFELCKNPHQYALSIVKKYANHITDYNNLCSNPNPEATKLLIEITGGLDDSQLVDLSDTILKYNPDQQFVAQCLDRLDTMGLLDNRRRYSYEKIINNLSNPALLEVSHKPTNKKIKLVISKLLVHIIREKRKKSRCIIL